jgi:two-component system sensor histidine kinase BarA
MASSGNQAIEMVKSASERPYDLIFIDINMPRMDGIETSTQIMEYLSGGPKPITIAVTGDDPQIYEGRVTKAGISQII